MKFISITGYKRPNFFRQLIESLVRNDLSDWQIEIQLEPSEFANEYAAIAKQLLHTNYNIVINPERLGVRLNPYKLLSRIFDGGASTVLYLEEDVVVSADVTRLAKWYEANYRDEWLCLSLLSGGCGSYGFISYPTYEDLLFTSKMFNSLGFVLNRQGWGTHFRDRWLIDESNARDYDGKKTIGWDWSIFHYLCRRKGLYCLSPATARATHTGREGGEHCKPAWHDLAFGGLPLAIGLHRDAYKVVDIPALPANVRRHALMWQQMIDVMLKLADLKDEPRPAPAQLSPFWNVRN